MEKSHRGADIISIAKQTEADMRALMEIPDNFKVFTLQGGASLQFSCICLNLVGKDKNPSANYLTTGHWSEVAIKEGKKYLNTNEVANIDKGGDMLNPKSWKIKKNAKFFHYCDNETIQGIEWHNFPYHAVPKDQPLIADMSANFASKRIDWSKYGVVYASASKNIGPAGCAFVIVREDLLNKARADTPTICNWTVFANAMT
jgi:phosphoserine aminotransferase